MSNMQLRVPKYWAFIIVIAIGSLILTLYGFLRGLSNYSMVFELPFIFFFNSLIPSETDYVFSGVKLTPAEKGRYKEKIVKSLTNLLAVAMVLAINHRIAKSLWEVDPHFIVVADFVGLFLSAFILLLLYKLLKDRSRYLYVIASVVSVACSSVIVSLCSTYL